MRRLEHIAVWCLLAVFAVGGVLGPSLHRVKHGMEEIASAPERPCHSSEVHTTDVPLWTQADRTIRGLECDLCATRLLVTLPSLGPGVVPEATGTTWTSTRSHLTSAFVVADTFIRGPPPRA